MNNKLCEKTITRTGKTIAGRGEARLRRTRGRLRVFLKSNFAIIAQLVFQCKTNCALAS